MILSVSTAWEEDYLLRLKGYPQADWYSCLPREIVRSGRQSALLPAVTADNAQRFEDAELICEIQGSKLVNSEDDNLRGTVEWVMDLHQEVVSTVERSRAYARTAQNLFANLPAKGSPRDVITTRHQLEQLTSALGDNGISTIEEPAIREALRAVRHIHDNRRERGREIAERYKLSV